MFVFTGCSVKACTPGWDRHDEFTTEYFVCWDYSYGNFDPYIAITELTDLGKQQEILVVPETIRGKPVELLGTKHTSFGIPAAYSATWESDNLKKLFCLGGGAAWLTKEKLPNAEDVLCIGNVYNGFKSDNISPDPETVPFYSYSSAHVAYYYNYTDSQNSGHYWIDNYTYGDRITYIPPSPERGGYTFGGWYKEAECINEWDYENDRLPEEILDENNEVVFQQTKLYAKWTENN